MRITTEKISKRYPGNVWGLKEFSLDLGPGVLGLLGPNGAGKTTLMNMIATVTKPTEGRIRWNDIDIVKSPQPLRKVLGYLPQNFGVYPNLNVTEFLTYIAALKGISGSAASRRIDQLVQLVNLTDARKQPLRSYSGGMKQRVGIAQALLNDPQLLIVDEPTVGLDPEERVRFRSLLSDLAGNRIVILSTHIVSDVEATATEIIIINNGGLIMRATPEKFLATVDGKVWTIIVPSEELNKIRENETVSNSVRRSDGVHVRIVGDKPPDEKAEPCVPTLEDAYLYAVAGRNSKRASSDTNAKLESGE